MFDLLQPSYIYELVYIRQILGFLLVTVLLFMLAIQQFNNDKQNIARWSM